MTRMDVFTRDDIGLVANAQVVGLDGVWEALAGMLDTFLNSGFDEEHNEEARIVQRGVKRMVEGCRKAMEVWQAALEDLSQEGEPGYSNGHCLEAAQMMVSEHICKDVAVTIEGHGLCIVPLEEDSDGQGAG